MYQEVILDHYRQPHGRGLREPFDAEVMHVNPTCGDEITLRVQLGEGADPAIEDVSYWSQGCSISQASASVLFEEVQGRPVSRAFAILDEFVEVMHSKGEGHGDEEVLGDLVAFEGVSKFPARVKCALLSWMALKDAVGQARDELAVPMDVGLDQVSLSDLPQHQLHADRNFPKLDQHHQEPAPTKGGSS